MIVVADTGPLLHLHWVDASPWALPPQEIEVVDPVWQEVERRAPAALRDPRLVRTPVAVPLSSLLADFLLDDGERAALSHAIQCKDLEPTLVLCDEHAARRACVVLALPVTGSIGLILEAVRAGRVTPQVAERTLRDLPERGRLYVSRNLLDLALAALAGSGPP